MVSDPLGIPLLIGAKYDPTFGMVLLAGMGGIGAELYNDLALELPPLNERLARRMLEGLRLWPLLNGFAGRPAVNVDRLAEILIRLSYLIADFPEIRELDVNPLLVTPGEVTALDARIIVHPQQTSGGVPGASAGRVRSPYSHLAIRPYPEDLIRKAALKGGSGGGGGESVLLRPIRPEDEPMWHEMLGACSQETLLFRFFASFKNTTHQMATRYCFIDYDREMAIVAEIREACGRRRLVGVGRLVSGDADRRDAEFAVVVCDEFQGRGLGSLLTDYCIGICMKWGIESIIAETSPNNRRMLGLFESRGFEMC
uniref:N-acetyltransferase domain-containing protein n=1 Tax=Odontella aurita TaxID=265563 RepID=A0A6U6FKK4_9STRA|mmetsp:Transcript_36299/g.108859  ORF Transcript_36299/g.108859 Transcript_36299/m.108859 type:complete len:313 (+) Transcript_36299:2348-3286(+)